MGVSDSSKVTIDVVRAAMALAERDVELGLATVEQIRSIPRTRFAPAERKQIAALLKAEGKSNREIAEELGASHQTIGRDLGGPSGPENGPDGPGEGSELEQSRKREDALREQLRIAQSPTIMPSRRYGTIVIDPPWPMKKIEREVRPNQVEFDYPTMDYEALRAFRVKFGRLAGDHCHVFMWTTQKFLPMALRLLEDYEIKYVLTMVWHKAGGFQPVGLPQYNCEFVLYGRIGAPEFIDTKAFDCCFEAPRTEHSRKPGAFYDLVRRVTPDGRIDVFSREKREGFDQYGNEPAKFSEAAE
jgi:N6-adenosine-specific RNA methylase IME4/transposase-like protein